MLLHNVQSDRFSLMDKADEKATQQLSHITMKNTHNTADADNCVRFCSCDALMGVWCMLADHVCWQATPQKLTADSKDTTTDSKADSPHSSKKQVEYITC